MIKNRKRLMLLLALAAVVILTPTIYYISKNSSAVKNDTKKEDISSIKYAYVRVLKSGEYGLDKYQLVNNGTINISIPAKKEFIISFDSRKNSKSTWNIKNKLDDKIIALKDMIWTNPVTNNGDDAFRQNFHFSGKKAGIQKLEMEYGHTGAKPDETIKVTVNVTIQ